VTANVSSLAGVDLDGTQYLFIVVNESRFEVAITEALRSSLQTFGETIGRAGRVITGFARASEALTGELLQKPWSDTVRDMIEGEQSPMMLVIAIGVETFDPRKDDWRVVRFTQANAPAKHIPYLFHTLASGIARDEHPFEIFDRIKDPASGHFRGGQVVGPNDEILDAINIPNSCLDPSWGLVSEVVRLGREEGLTSVFECKGRLVRAACENLKDRNEFPFDPGSVVNALRKAAAWNDIEAKLKE
jgi:hypothetical protein